MADRPAPACFDHRKAANCQRDHVTGECVCRSAAAPSEPNVVDAERLAVIAVRGALQDAYQHGYRNGMKRGQEMAAWGYMTPDAIAAAREKAEQKERLSG